MNDTRLELRLRALRGRVAAIGAGAALFWGVAAGLLGMVVAAWLDLMLDLTPALRVGALVASAVAAVVVLGIVAARTRRLRQWPRLARALEFAGDTGGQIVSGTDLLLANQNSAAAVTEGLRQMAIARAGALAARAPLGRAAPVAPLGRAVAAAAIAGLVIGAALVLAPLLVQTQWARLTDPWGDHPPYARLRFAITPGNMALVYGGGAEIRAEVLGGTTDRLDVVLLTPRGEDIMPMFAEPGGKWRTTLANLTEPGSYFVRARGARSRKFALRLITVPRIEAVSFRITPPAYTRLGAYEGPLPQHGLAGLPGAKIEVRAQSNRPLAGGTLAIAAEGKARPLLLQAQGMEARGEFVVEAAGKITLGVRDVGGQESTEKFSTSLTLLTDERPFVRILEPRASSFATPDAMLPLHFIAEDGYGISRVELFRSLNDSRALGAEIPLPSQQPTRFPGTAQLALAPLGLRPGDMIKLYARVEDNDPQGAKGSESPVVTIQIISQEQYTRMMMTRAGIELLMSKYQQAARRMEALEAELRKFRAQLAKLRQKDPVALEQRAQARKLAGKAREDAEETWKAVRQVLPLDIDRALTPALEKVAQRFANVADGLGNIAERDPERVEEALAALDELLEQLKGEEQKYAEQVTAPLEYLGKIVPLLLDQEKFVALYQHQKDFTQRVGGVRGQKVGDDPKLKIRMREWEAEQAQIRQGLLELLDNIKSHAAALPDDPRIDEFRKSAEKFAAELREAAADEPMAGAERALAEFWAQKAFEEAGNAADILEKFIAQAGNMGGAGKACLKFQPTLAGMLGNTITQLVGASGGMGGEGDAGGMAYGSSMQNIGLYGYLPPDAGGRTGGRPNEVHVGPAAETGGVGDRFDPRAAAAGARTPAAASGAAVTVPPAWKQRVGQYFQRVADEIPTE